MSETSVSASKGITSQNVKIESASEFPQEFAKKYWKFHNSKVSGLIYPAKSVKLDKNQNHLSENEGPSFATTDFYSSTMSNIRGDELSMSEKNNQMEILFNELKADMREREARTRTEISDREARFENQLDRYINESIKREENINKKFDDTIKKIDESLKNVEVMKNQNFFGNIAVFGALVAIIITLIVI